MKNPTWNDTQLLSHNFNILARPDLDDGIIKARPPADVRLTFLAGYNITPPFGVPNRLQLQPFVWCALCQEATHWKGWKAQYTAAGGGQVTCLIGQDCAKRKGGAAIRIAANEFKARKTRSEVLQERAAVLPLLPGIKAALETWNQDPSLAAVMTWRQQLRSVGESFAQRVIKAASVSPAVFQVEQEVRDHAAEAKRDARTPRARGTPIYCIQYRSLGRIEGRALYAGPNPNARIGLLTEKLCAAAAILVPPTDDRAVRDLQHGLKLLREVADGGRELAQAYDGFEKGLTDDAVDLLARWYNATPRMEALPSQMVRKGRRLVIACRYNDAVIIDIPSVGAICRPDILARLETALLGRPGYSPE